MKSENLLVVQSSSLVSVRGEVLLCEFVAAKDVEVEAIDHNVVSDAEVAGADEFHVVIDVLVLLSCQERTLNDTRVLLSRLEDRDRVVSKIERDNESPVNVLWHLRVELSSVSQDLLVVVDVLEEIDLGLLRHKVIDVAKRVDLVTETVVRRNLHNNGGSGLRLLNLTKREVSLVLLQIVVLSGLVNTANSESSTVSSQTVIEGDLITRQISVADERLARLVDIESLRKLLSSEVDRERISAVVREVHLSDLNGVISQEVMPDKLKVITSSEESENLAVVVQELLLRSNSASAKLLLKILKELRILLGRHRLLGLGEAIFGAGLCFSLRASQILYKEIMRYIKFGNERQYLRRRTVWCTRQRHRF